MSMPNKLYSLTCPNCHHTFELYLKQSINVNLEMLDGRTLEQVFEDEYFHECPNYHKIFDERDVDS